MMPENDDLNDDGSDPYASSSYVAFLNAAAKECSCGCFKCGARPCAGVLAGGLCDDMTCDCAREDDEFDDRDDEDWL